MDNPNWNHKNIPPIISKASLSNEKVDNNLQSTNLICTQLDHLHNMGGNSFNINDNFSYNNSGRNGDLSSLTSISSLLLGEDNFLNNTLTNPQTNEENIQRLYRTISSEPQVFFPHQHSNLSDIFQQQPQQPLQQLSNDDPNGNGNYSNVPHINDIQEEVQHDNDSVNVDINLVEPSNEQEMNIMDAQLAELVNGFFPVEILGFDGNCQFPAYNEQQQQPQQENEPFIEYNDSFNNQYDNDSSNNFTQMKQSYDFFDQQMDNHHILSNRRSLDGDNFDLVVHQHQPEASNEMISNQWNMVSNVGGQVFHQHQQEQQQLVTQQNPQNPPTIENVDQPTISSPPSRNPITMEQYNALVNQFLRKAAPQNQHVEPPPPPPPQLHRYSQSTPTYIPGINPSHMHVLQRNNFNNPPLVSNINGTPYFVRNNAYTQLVPYHAHQAARPQIPLERIIRPGYPVNRYANAKHPKPVFSYSCLIAMALKNTDTGSLPVNEIYKYMQDKFPYFKTAPEGWKNSVRHNLSLNKAFYKIVKSEHAENKNQRKGCYWALKQDKRNAIEKEINKWLKKHPEAIRKSLQNEGDFNDLFQNVEDSSDDTNGESSVTLDMNYIKTYIMEDEEKKRRKSANSYMNYEYGEHNHQTTSQVTLPQNYSYDNRNSNNTNNAILQLHQHQEALNTNNVRLNNNFELPPYNNNTSDMPINAYIVTSNNNTSDMLMNYPRQITQTIYGPVGPEDNNINNNLSLVINNTQTLNRNVNNNNIINNIETQDISNADFVDNYLRQHHISEQFPSLLPMSLVDTSGNEINNGFQLTDEGVVVLNNNVNADQSDQSVNLTQEQMNQILTLTQQITNARQTPTLQDVLDGSTIFQGGNEFNNNSFNVQPKELQNTINNEINLKNLINSFNKSKNNNTPQ